MRSQRVVICIAGFGDNASMFEPLLTGPGTYDLKFQPINLPGFGAPPLPQSSTSLSALADVVVDAARAHGAETVLAHSVASIIATLAAERLGSPIKTILSLEGNLTPEDAYFSGTAANFASPEEFLPVFLTRLDEMATDDKIIARYRDVVKTADPKALWELGCDAHAFSQKASPGDRLQRSANIAYLYNPANVPQASLDWLARSNMPRYELPGASHWASLDQPEALYQAISSALGAVIAAKSE